MIPLPAGCARNQGFFKPSNKRKMMDHRIRRLRLIQDNAAGSFTNGLNDFQGLTGISDLIMVNFFKL